MEVVKRETDIVKTKVKKAYVIFNGKRYMASDNGRETLIFRCDNDFNPIFHTEVGGAKGVKLKKVLADFEGYLWPKFLR